MIIYPSNAHIWVKCAGHTALAERTPRYGEQDGTARLEGILAHNVARDIADSGTTRRTDVTDEMLDGGVMWRDVLLSWGCEFRQEVVYENINWLGNGVPGRTDAEGYDPLTNTLHVGDYKFGHRYVDAYENWQLLCYAMGWLDRHHKELGDNLETLKIALHVVQPRAGGHRVWEITIEKLREVYAKKLVDGAYASRQAKTAPDGLGLKLYSVGEHCYGCAGAINCPALRDASAAALEFGGRAIELELTPEQAALELMLIDLASGHIKNRRDALEQMVFHKLQNGAVLPHWGLSHGRGSKKWKAESEAEVLSLADLYGVEVVTTKLKTPTQCAKLLPSFVIDSHTETTQGALKLTKKSADDGAKLFS